MQPKHSFANNLKRKLQDKTSQSNVHVVEETSSEIEVLYFAMIYIDCSGWSLIGDEAFAKLKVDLLSVGVV